MLAINQEKHIEDVKSLQITLLPIMMEEWHINGTELQELLSKYDLLKYIEVCYDYYNSMGIRGVLDDISEYIKLQGGTVPKYKQGGDMLKAVVKILKRIKEHGVTIGYQAIDKQKNGLFIGRNEIYNYNLYNAYINRSGEIIAKKGFIIKTIHKEDEAKVDSIRTSIMGKHKLLAVSRYSDLSLTQKKLLRMLENTDRIEIDKYNIKITMKDLACMTAVTGLEYALFERNDKYRLVKGSSSGMQLDLKYTGELVNKKYSWVGHTHPGTTRLCLFASDSDYNTLKCLGQRQSVIYNSCGDYNVFGIGGKI